ncbi:unnamed protein product [Parnassius apollo]|uniref:(apollo) hypothetical protein n=1 Tax=Parnassius apollo TaxID=110799 RepID=A0A8S3W2I7_PARAO|nr:unnamed protein product [Parnassius apollo]
MKKVQKSSSSDDTDLEIDYAESGDSEWNEDSDSIVENTEDKNKIVTEKRRLKLAFHKKPQKKSQRPLSHPGSDLENMPLSSLASSRGKVSVKDLKTGCYVIVTYEGEYFPGKIEDKDRGMYEISTMVLSTGNTFRWPDRADKIWYKLSDIIERIRPPIKQNNRGFFKVAEMNKFLPDIYMT